MLALFPTPYENELLYSILARYHRWSKNINPKDTLFEVFGTTSACAVIDLPNHLEALHNKLSRETLIKPDILIYKHTLFPVYSPFLPVERAVQIEKAMMASSKGHIIHSTIGIMASSIKAPTHLRYCPLCFREDMELKGEAYWHRVHQLPGVFICPIHEVNIIDSSVNVLSGNNKQSFVTLEESFIKLNKAIEVEHLLHHIAVARAYQWLLDNKPNIIGLKGLQKKYLRELQKQGLATPAYRVRQKDLTEAFIGFYGLDFLNQLNCMVDYKQQDNWLTKIVREPRISAHPLRHILLMRFLGLTPDDFFNKNENFYPFGKAPWLCFNKASMHYMQEVITKCEISRGYKTKAPVGTFKCSCGFIYSRRGPDTCVEDRYRIGTIKNFGHVWEGELIRIRDEGMSVGQMAKHLKVDQKTIKRYLEKNENVEAVVDDEMGFGDVLNDYRSKLIELKENNLDKSKTELRKLSPGLFTWLYRHDNDWLMNNSPAPAKKKYVNNQVDWTERDWQLAQITLKVINSIKNNSDKPLRITISLIGRKTGKLSLLQKHIDKLPQTKKLLDKYCETIEEFQIKRVTYAAQELRNRGELTEWRLIRAAGLRPGYSLEVEKQIDKEVEAY